jgi:hypothetical protein
VYFSSYVLTHNCVGHHVCDVKAAAAAGGVYGAVIFPFRLLYFSSLWIKYRSRQSPLLDKLRHQQQMVGDSMGENVMTHHPLQDGRVALAALTRIVSDLLHPTWSRQTRMLRESELNEASRTGIASANRLKIEPV